MLPFSISSKKNALSGKPVDTSQGVSLILPERIDGPSIQVGWCLSSQLTEELKERCSDREQPYLLFSVGLLETPRYASGEVMYRKFVEKYRRLVPLDQGMDYFDLFFSGQNYIAAAVVVGRRSKLEAAYCDLGSPSIISQSVSPSDEWTESFRSFALLAFGASLALVDVPREAFAKKPWDYGWLNLLSKDRKFLDNCSVRRYRLYAYTVQPFVLLFLAVLSAGIFGIRSIPLVWLWIKGYRSINWSVIVDLDSVIQDEVYRCHSEGRSVYGDWFSSRLLALFGRFPIVGRCLEWWGLRREECEKRMMRKSESRRLKEEERDRVAVAKMYGTLSTKLSCALGDSQEGLSIQPTRFTLTLGYRELKSRVCKPFAAN